MIARILWYIFLAALTVLLIIWLLSGGFSAVVRFVKTVPNPIDIIWGTSTSTYQVKLPWQQDLPRGADITGLASQGDTQLGGSSLSAPSGSIYTHGSISASDFGTPSPQRGLVSLSEGSARESDPRLENVEVASQSGSAVSLAGWSLQSALTGLRVFLPPAAPILRQNGPTATAPLRLAPGENAIVTTGASPIGVSFQETRCTGYLNGSNFQPSLQRNCPSSSTLVPLTTENIQRYGSDCVDYARALPACTTPNVPSSMTPGCQAFVRYTFSYQGCVDQLAGQSDFALPTWRIYLNSASEFWDNRHDTIRLLDASGLTVDAIAY